MSFGALDLDSTAFTVSPATWAGLARGGLRVTIRLSPPVGLPGVSVTRIAEAYPGVAGFRTQTVIATSAPLLLSRASLDEVAPATAVAPTLHAFRAGGDWREPDWPGPPFTIGDPHPGDWRDTHSAAAGPPLEGPGEWPSPAAGERSAFMVTESNDLPSSRARYDRHAGTAGPDV